MQSVVTIAHRHGASITITEGVAFIWATDLSTQALLVQDLVDARLFDVPWQAGCPHSSMVFSNDLARAFTAYYGHLG
ncbi:MAG: hypothetical protein VKJ09_09840 [Leptolyngbya sp.]|nr:hypothetical protein [Leptolyngbya sp.]